MSWWASWFICNLTLVITHSLFPPPDKKGTTTTIHAITATARTKLTQGLSGRITVTILVNAKVTVCRLFYTSY